MKHPGKILLWPVLLALAGCGIGPQSAPAAIPTVMLDNAASASTAPVQTPAPAAALPSGGSAVSASAVVAAAQEARLAFAASGNIASIAVVVGDSVQEGQVLARLADTQQLSAAVAAAQLELVSAQQALADLKDSADQARAQAQLRLAQAKDAYEEAEKHRGWKEYRIGDDNQIDLAHADLIVAEDTLKNLEGVYGGYADSPEDNLNKAAALSALSAARRARDTAEANLNYLLSLPDPIEVEKVEAELEVARAELADAQRDFDALKDGPDPAALRLAQTRVDTAQAQFDAGQIALAGLEIKAPFAGVIALVELQTAEWAAAGQPVLTLVDLDHMRVLTTDLSERDAPGVQAGQSAQVFIKALGVTVSGQVRRLSPLADTLGGDVVYQAVIDLPEPPAGLLAGMSAEVSFDAP